MPKTRSTFMDTIENSDRKLIPSAIAAKNENIAELEGELATALKTTSEGKEAV